MGAEKKPAGCSELYFLRRLEPAICGAAVFDNLYGFLARPPDCKGARASEAPVAGCQRLHEPEHARVLQIWKFSPAKFPMAARAHRNRLPTAASGHLAASRHFILHLPFALLYAGHLSRGASTDAIFARFRAGGFVFPTARCRAVCARWRFFAAAQALSATQRRPVLLGTGAYDAGPV